MATPRYLYWRNRRAAPSAYWIDNRITVAEVEALPEGVRSVPDRATGPRRTARPAYQVDTSWIMNVLTGTVFPPPATYRMSIASPLRLPRRAANAAYWIRNDLEGNVPIEAMPEGHPSISDIFRMPLLAPRSAYWIPPYPIDNLNPIPLPEGQLLMPSRAPGSRRASNTAYWVPNRIEGNVPPEPGEDLPPGTVLFPSQTRGAERGSNVLYWLVNLLEGNVPPPPPPVTGANLPPYGQVIFNSADEENRPRYGQRIARGTEE